MDGRWKPRRLWIICICIYLRRNFWESNNGTTIFFSISQIKSFKQKSPRNDPWKSQINLFHFHCRSQAQKKLWLIFTWVELNLSVSQVQLFLGEQNERHRRYGFFLLCCAERQIMLTSVTQNETVSMFSCKHSLLLRILFIVVEEKMVRRYEMYNTLCLKGDCSVHSAYCSAFSVHLIYTFSWLLMQI